MYMHTFKYTFKSIHLSYIRKISRNIEIWFTDTSSSRLPPPPRPSLPTSRSHQQPRQRPNLDLFLPSTTNSRLNAVVEPLNSHLVQRLRLPTTSVVEKLTPCSGIIAPVPLREPRPDGHQLVVKVWLGDCCILFVCVIISIWLLSKICEYNILTITIDNVYI